MNFHSIVSVISGSRRVPDRHGPARRAAVCASVIAVVASLFLALPTATAAPNPDSGPAAGGTVVTVPVPGADSFLQISAGSSHSLALDADGNLWTWGSDGEGQLGNGAATGDVTAPAQITTGTTYTSIAAGYSHSLALDADGNLWTWGEDSAGRLGNGATTGNVTAPAQVITGTTYTAIAAGFFHSLALDAAGNLWTWGYGGAGELGNGTTTGTVTAPTQTTTDTTYTAIAAGPSHSLALDDAGNLWTWGDDVYGQLGNGAPTGNVTAPAQVITGATYTAIAAGFFHSLALDDAGNLWSWGWDGYGQLGNGAAGDVTAPAQVTAGTVYTAIAAGYLHSLALDADGTLWTWGYDDTGQLGNGAPTGSVPAPAMIAIGTAYTAIAAGDSHSLALDAVGNLWTWGSDGDGRLGNGAPTGNVTAPAQITTGTTYTAITTGNYHSLTLDADGNLWTWGYDGNGPTGNVTAPAQVTTGTTYTAVADGYSHSLALDADGNLWTWGWDSDGQLGNGALTGNVTAPAQITTGTVYAAIAAGDSHSLALDADGNLWTWGYDGYGQLGNGAPTGNVTAPAQVTTGTTYAAIAAGRSHSLAIAADGNLWTWGDDGAGQLGNGALTGDVTAPAQITTGTVYAAIAAGDYHSLALDADGNLWTWGWDSDGQLGNGALTGIVTAPAQVTTGTTYTAIGAGYVHSLALDADGNLWTWGWDSDGQLGNGALTGIVTAPAQVTTGTTYTAITAGGFHSLALDADGNLWTWGGDGDGQLGNGAPTGTVTTPARIGGTTLIIGIAFDGVFGTDLDRFGETLARVTTPAGTPGAATITIQYSYDGETKPTLTLPQPFTYLTAPGVPTGLTATRGDGEIALSWTAPGSDGGDAITDYLIEYSDDDAATWSTFSDGTSTATTTTVTPLTNGTEYTFRVSATNTVGTGGASTVAALTPGAVPGVPTGLTATRGDGEIALSWTAPGSDGGDAITDYLVEYSNDDAETWSTFSDGTSTATTATVTSLTNGTEYTFRVSASNTVGTGSASTLTMSTPGAVPGVPTGLAATRGDGEVVLSWTAPASDGGDAITDYLVEYSDDDAETWSLFADGVSTATTATVTSLTNGTEYTFRVSASNTVGTGSASAVAASTPGAVPGALVMTGLEVGGLLSLGGLLLAAGLILLHRKMAVRRA